LLIFLRRGEVTGLGAPKRMVTARLKDQNGYSYREHDEQTNAGKDKGSGGKMRHAPARFPILQRIYGNRNAIFFGTLSASYQVATGNEIS